MYVGKGKFGRKCPPNSLHWVLLPAPIIAFRQCRALGYSSKRLKGQLDPPVSDVTFFGSKEVSWIPLSLMLRFWIKGGQLVLVVADTQLIQFNVWILPKNDSFNIRFNIALPKIQFKILFNSKKFCWFNSKDNSIQKSGIYWY